jgi:hypothetical protein
MNIDDVKNRIAQHEAEIAVEIGRSVAWLQDARNKVKDALSQRRVIIARHRKRLMADDRLTEMRLRHEAEMLALRREIQSAVDAFDADPDAALHNHLSLTIDGYFPEVIEGCKAMDAHERQLWAEYRSQ